jgi:hypothetical protein
MNVTVVFDPAVLGGTIPGGPITVTANSFSQAKVLIVNELNARLAAIGFQPLQAALTLINS